MNALRPADGSAVTQDRERGDEEPEPAMTAVTARLPRCLVRDGLCRLGGRPASLLPKLGEAILGNGLECEVVHLRTP